VAKGNQPEAVSHSFGIIEVHKRDCGAPAGGNAFDATAVEAKMATPSLLARIEEEDDLARERVNRGEVRALEPVAMKAGPRQILEGSRPPVLFRNHTVDEPQA
jgi:hypothetical protein